MTEHWSATDWGLRVTGSVPWSLSLDDNAVRLVASTRELSLPLGTVSPPVEVRQGWFWSSVRFMPMGEPVLEVDGLPNRHARRLAEAIQKRVDRHRHQEAQRLHEERLAARRNEFTQCIGLIARYRAEVLALIEQHDAEHRWFTTESTREAEAQRPPLSTPLHTLECWWSEPDIQRLLGDRASQVRGLLLWLHSDLSVHISERNERHMAAELLACKDLLDRVEKRPLNDEQRRAVICMDSRVLTVAAAGSGKTSTMVAKAAYAVHRKLVSPEAIVMLAFNKDAARELGERVQLAFERVGLDASRISTMTFHKLGSDIIGAANRRKRRIAPWVEADDIAHLGLLIRRLRDTDADFGAKWDLFRFVFGRDVPKFNTEEKHEDWIGEKTGFRTVRGDDVVKSLQELTIANWLYYNGIDYRYEAPFGVDTATSTHSQYRPDFYYPTLNLYHEHFAIDAQGRAPSHFSGYLSGAEWKRQQHRQHGTNFFETRSAQFYNGSLFALLAQELTARGAVLDPNPHRPVADFTVLEDEALTRLLRTFLIHAKSNARTMAQLRQRVQESASDAFAYRHSLFLDLYEKVRVKWDQALDEADAIDFEDMLVQSADHLEAGRWVSPYRLVMLDEFQDASAARARMARGLVHGAPRHLFAVGDDWQSINRFAGADVSVMTGFADWFGRGPTLRLEETFRCPQALCDVSSTFVAKNPSQLKKKVRSETPVYGPVVEAFQVGDKPYIAGAIRTHLASLVGKLESGEHPLPAKGKASVFVLGRYNKDREYIPADWPVQFGHKLDVSFSTVHGSKGLEADYVVLPSLVRKGFPSAKQDDPVLLLAMPPGDEHPFAEERRLLYVALTRARRSVAIFTVAGKVSEFLVELMRDQRLTLNLITGEPADSTPCPKCDTGVMVRRSNQWGPWYGCSTYPLCKHKFSERRRR